MKILKHKNITGIILGLLLLMPFLSILARSAYVVVNKNAYQSYYGETINEYDYLSVETYENVNNYVLKNDTSLQTETLSNSYYFTFDTIDSYSLTSTTEIDTLDGENYDYCIMYYNTSYSIRYLGFVSSDYGSIYINMSTINYIKFTNFTYNGDNWDIWQPYLYTIEYNNYSYLDNVFEYSVSNFVEDNNIGNLDLTSWFFDLFLEDNSVNNLYVNFANWYMNYAMLITLMHFLFLVLMWFINYSRRLLDRGMNYDW